MDSVTQFALGATVGAVTLGPRIGARRAALVGGILGTLPDLDSFLPTDDPVQAFTSHRGATHSLLFQAVVTPLLAEPLVRFFNDLRDRRMLVYLTVYAILASHALIDAMTVYGTQLFWPFGPEPVGLGSIFIIDPIYTAPLLVVTVWALFRRELSDRLTQWLKGALVVSSVYMALTAPVQAWMTTRAHQYLADRGIEPDRLISTPTPFNTLYWRTLAIDGDRYLNVYAPVFGDGDDVTVYVHPRHTGLGNCLVDTLPYQSLEAFTDGFFRFEIQDDKIVMADLRMGLTPNYVFRFGLAELKPFGIVPLDTPTRERQPRGNDGDVDWLLAGMAGDRVLRLAEADSWIDLDDAGAGTIDLAEATCQMPVSGASG